MEDEMEFDGNIKFLVRRWSEIKKRKSELNSEIKELSDQEENIESLLTFYMLEQGVEKIGTTYGSVFIKNEEYPVIKNWQMFWEYIRENNITSILKHSIKSKIWSSYKDQGVIFPGIGSFDKISILYRKK